MKIKELYLQALEKISESDAKKILLCLSLGTMVAVADYVGLFDTNKDKTKEDTNITYTLPAGYTLGDNNMGYKEIVRVETIDPIKHVNPETGEVTYTAPAGYTLKGNRAYRYVTYMEFIPPTVTKIH